MTPVEEAVDAVKIMTVHTAKGLEFPVVFLPFCDTTSNRSRQMVINDAVGILPFVGNEVPPSLSLYRKLENMNEQAEITRLFYVACTRAMDKLVLTTSSKKPGSKSGINSFTDVLGRTLDLFSPPPSGYFELPSVKILVHHAVSQVQVHTAEETGRKPEVGEVSLAPVHAGTGGEFYSATLLQTFKLCETKYFLRYRLGMPVQETGDGRQETGGRLLDSGPRSPASSLRLEDYDDAILSTVKGQLVHSVLEKVLSTDQSSEETVANVAKLTVSAGVGQRLAEADANKLTGVIVENVNNAL
ncbi:MAG: hypothetical protein M1378_12340, partial [Bacteroidetes bacterium]|nr:hypothetical protein [Bacteroidota bacterium]